jgi:hypothetical protein
MVRTALVPTLLLLLSACRAPDKDLLDPDGDGYELDADCDDEDSSVNPGAVEIWYDGVDQDCNEGSDYDQDGDGVDAALYGGEDCDDLDPSVTTRVFYADTDDDGYGVEDTTQAGCEAPGGWATVAGDCDDENSAVNPGAAEVCDLLDNDCDGRVDQDALDAPSWARDGDNDGYGDPDDVRADCAQPTGYAAKATDCDDVDPTVYPGAFERCDGQDNDCDGVIPDEELDDDGDGDVECSVDAGGWDGDTGVDGGGDCDDDDASVSPDADERCGGGDDDCDGETDEDDAVDAPTWYQDLDGDSFGVSSVSARSCEAPTDYAGSSGDCDDGDETVYPGALERCDGQDNDCDGVIPSDERDDDGDDAVECSLDSGGWDGAGSLSGDDCDDGDPSRYVGAPEVCDDGAVNDCDGTTPDASRSCRLTGTHQMDAAGSPALSMASVTGEQVSSQFGRALLLPGDVTGDGLDDLVIGARHYSSTSSTSSRDGRVYTLSGAFGAVNLASSPGSAYATWTGAATTDYLGSSLATLPDLDGDGDVELILGAEYESVAASQGGGVSLILGGVAKGSSSVDLVDWSTLSLNSVSAFGGGAVAGLDDDGDGVGDTVLIGAARYDVSGTNAEGAVFVVSGLKSGSATLSSSSVRIEGVSAADWLGETVANIGDADGDGDDDFAVASVNHGAVYVFLDAPTTTVKATSADCILTSAKTDDDTGAAIRGGDLNGGGLAELIVGAPDADPSAGDGAGEVYLVDWGATPCSGSMSLRTSAYATLEGTVSDEGLGDALALPGDLDRDGEAMELAVGAPAAEGGVFNDAYNGRLYLWYGPVAAGAQSAAAADLILDAERDSSRFGGLGDGQLDYDGDGYPELVISAYQWSYGGSATGKVVVLGMPGI